MKASDWVAVLIAGLGILGTLTATVLAQLGEARRASRTQRMEAARRAEDRRDALAKERREVIRNDYREILRFIARTRLFVTEMRARLSELESWSATLSSDEREVEDLEARAQILKRRVLDDLPDVQSLVGAWATDNLIAIFDEIGKAGMKGAAHVVFALHLRLDGKRMPDTIADALGDLDGLVILLNQARDLLQAEQDPRLIREVVDPAPERQETTAR